MVEFGPRFSFTIPGESTGCSEGEVTTHRTARRDPHGLELGDRGHSLRPRTGLSGLVMIRSNAERFDHSLPSASNRKKGAKSEYLNVRKMIAQSTVQLIGQGAFWTA